MLRAILTCQLVPCPFRSLHGFHKIHFEQRALTTRQLQRRRTMLAVEKCGSKDNQRKQGSKIFRPPFFDILFWYFCSYLETSKGHCVFPNCFGVLRGICILIRIQACSRWLSVSDTTGMVSHAHEHPERMQAWSGLSRFDLDRLGQCFATGTPSGCYERTDV